MRHWSKAAGIIFLAVSSVYADKAESVIPPSAAKTDSSLFGETPTTQPVADIATTEPVTAAPAAEGESLTASQVNVSDDGNVEIHVNGANLVEVLRMLSMQCQRNIIASKEVRGTVTANLYDVTVREALDAVLQSNGYAYREKGNFIYVYSTKEIADIEKAERQPTSKVFRLFYTPAANAVNIIKPVLSATGQVAFTTAALSGLDTGVKDIGGNSHATEDVIVITDYPENLEAAAKVIKEIDRRPEQILIEATILRAALTDDNALGIDFNVLAGVNFDTVLNTNGQISNATSGAGATPAPVDLAHGVGSVGTGNNFSSQVPGGLKLGIVNQNLSVFLSALEGVTDTTVLANPKILALNKQKGEVIVGRKDGYLTTTVTESATVQSVDFLETGTRLVFRPYIADDGFIRMEIHPEDSSGGLTASNLPFKVTTEVTSNIMVKDGRTIVIGGLFRESSNSSRSQIPGLGNLPGVGALFRNQRDTTTREEVIILLTPHIIKDQEGYSKESLEALKDGERMRVGVRQGMMPWGRERLAESCFESAMTEWNKPNPDKQKVMWHLNCATNLNPKFLEAIKLKEEITGKEMWESDNSDIRGFVKRRIMADKDIAPANPPRVVDVSPTLRATSRPVMDLGPATRPIKPKLLTELPNTTQPSERVVELPSKSPAAPTTQPAPAPAPVAVTPTTQPAPVSVITPATQPTVSELPIEEITPGK